MSSYTEEFAATIPAHLSNLPEVKTFCRIAGYLPRKNGEVRFEVATCDRQWYDKSEEDQHYLDDKKLGKNRETVTTLLNQLIRENRVCLQLRCGWSSGGWPDDSRLEVQGILDGLRYIPSLILLEELRRREEMSVEQLKNDCEPWLLHGRTGNRSAS